MQDIQSWIEESLLDAVINDKIVTVKNIGNFLIVEDKYYIIEHDREVEVVKSYFESYQGQKQERLFDDHFRLILTNDEIEMVSDESLDVKYFLFQFGERWYYCDDWEHPELNEFKYLGKAVKEIDTNFPFLGIHGGYDLCNGSRLYKDWCKKAKFLGINTLGIAEENTLAGTLDFQTACKEAGIKSIIGETVTVKNNTGSYPLKLYVQNEEGWRNLLRINAEINVHNGGYVTEEKLLLFSSGLICVISPEAIEKIALPPFQQHFPNRLYFQFDLVEWDNSDRDKKWLEWIKTYLTNGWVDNIAPVIISDAYYLDKQDSKIRRLLNKIGGVKFKYNSKNQWFKSLDEIFSEISEVFNVEDNRLYELFEAGVSNLNSICENIDFTIEKKPRLPKYKMTQQENEKYNGDTVSMIVDLIEDGFNKKISGKVNNEDTYLERIEYELDLFIKGDMINYFLILWDIVNWCSQNDILVGIGRGSAAGSLVAYCIGLVDVDPLKYGLMIERFINPSRIGIDNADIDTDVPSAKREDIKRYMERRYGVDYVVSIGTYSTFKMRGAITALARCFSIPSSTTKFITKKIDAESSFTDLFKAELSVKEYIKNFPMVIDNLPSLLNQPQTSSIHAAGIVIVPEEYGTVYEQLPVKKMDGSLVSEWEGNYIEKTGYLKCDLLGLNQLDKFIAIIDTIKQTTGKKVTFEQIDLEQTRVYDLLCDGYCNDVFQFGTEGLEGYCKKMKPSNIYDLIAAVALYRPGAMESGGHEKYIKVKKWRRGACLLV